MLNAGSTFRQVLSRLIAAWGRSTGASDWSPDSHSNSRCRPFDRFGLLSYLELQTVRWTLIVILLPLSARL